MLYSHFGMEQNKKQKATEKHARFVNRGNKSMNRNQDILMDLWIVYESLDSD